MLVSHVTTSPVSAQTIQSVLEKCVHAWPDTTIDLVTARLHCQLMGRVRTSLESVCQMPNVLMVVASVPVGTTTRGEHAR